MEGAETWPAWAAKRMSQRDRPPVDPGFHSTSPYFMLSCCPCLSPCAGLRVSEDTHLFWGGGWGHGGHPSNLATLEEARISHRVLRQISQLVCVLSPGLEPPKQPGPMPTPEPGWGRQTHRYILSPKQDVTRCQECEVLVLWGLTPLCCGVSGFSERCVQVSAPASLFSTFLILPVSTSCTSGCLSCIKIHEYKRLMGRNFY